MLGQGRWGKCYNPFHWEIIMLRQFLKRFFITLFLLGAIGAAIIVAFNVWLSNAYAARIYTSIDDLSHEETPRAGSRRSSANGCRAGWTMNRSSASASWICRGCVR